MANLITSNSNTCYKLIICSNLGYSVRTRPKNACYQVRREAWSGSQCCSSNTSSSQQLYFGDQKVRFEIENDGENMKQNFESLVCEYGWRIRRLIENADEIRLAVQVQAEAFHVPVALFNDLFFQFFKVLLLSFFFFFFFTKIVDSNPCQMKLWDFFPFINAYIFSSFLYILYMEFSFFIS